MYELLKRDANLLILPMVLTILITFPVYIAVSQFLASVSLKSSILSSFAVLSVIMHINCIMIAERNNSIDKLLLLPVSKRTIVWSKFLEVFILNLILFFGRFLIAIFYKVDLYEAFSQSFGLFSVILLMNFSLMSGFLIFRTITKSFLFFLTTYFFLISGFYLINKVVVFSSLMFLGKSITILFFYGGLIIPIVYVTEKVFTKRNE